jgi:hypothetical protein
MARPIDPTSRIQVEQRAKRLRSEESGWTRSLCLGIALAALKAWQWTHYLENGGDPGPLAGSFPKLPEEPGCWVVVGARPQGVLRGSPEASEAEILQEVVLEGDYRSHPDQAIWGLGPTDGTQSRVRLLRGDQWLEDGQAEGCEVPDREQLARALELADLLQKRLQPLLRPSFYLEASLWIGELLKAPRAEAYSPSEDHRHRAVIWVDPQNWEVMGLETVMEGRAVLQGAPGFPWPGDLWRVPVEPLGIPSEKALQRHNIPARVSEAVALSAAAWHFGRVLYRKALPGHADSLGCRGLEKLEDLRELLEELKVLKPEGEKMQPIGGKTLAPLVTTQVPMVTTKALIRKDRWEEQEEGHGAYTYIRPSDVNGSGKWEITFRDREQDFGYASWKQCLQILEKGGLEMATLHHLLCLLVAQQENQGARFEVRGDDALEALGYGNSRGGKAGSRRSDLLKKLAITAWLLDGVQCEGKARIGKTGERIQMARGGRIWNIEYRAVGDVQLTLPMEGNEETSGTITDLRLIVTPGTWIEHQRTLKGDRLLYAPFSPRILQLGRYKQELAYRIGAILGMEARIKWKTGRAQVQVERLLREVGLGEMVEKARRDRRTAHDLRQKWNAAMVTLQQVVGFRFEFPPEHYHEALIPEDLRPAEMGEAGPTPPKALEELLASRLVIHFPEEVAEALQAALPVEERKALPRPQPEKRKERTEQRQSRPNSVRLKEALEHAKASGAITGRRQVAERLQLSVSQLSKRENGHIPLPERELKRCLALLETLRPKAQR